MEWVALRGVADGLTGSDQRTAADGRTVRRSPQTVAGVRTGQRAARRAERDEGAGAARPFRHLVRKRATPWVARFCVTPHTT
jgi:hypothetical protein